MKSIEVFNIGKEWMDMLDYLDEAQGELVPDTERMLESLMVATESEVERAVSVIQYLKSVSQTAKEEADRIKGRQKSAEKVADIIRERVALLMSTAQLKKVKTPKYTVSLLAGKDSVQIDDADIIPASYLQIVYTPMKSAIGETLKAGGQVTGCRLITGQPTISIR